jgi:hypothetical protein
MTLAAAPAQADPPPDWTCVSAAEWAEVDAGDNPIPTHQRFGNNGFLESQERLSPTHKYVVRWYEPCNQFEDTRIKYHIAWDVYENKPDEVSEFYTHRHYAGHKHTP